MKSFNKQFGKKLTHIDQVIRTVFENYTIYIVAFDDLQFSGVKITAPRVGLCAPNITLVNSNVEVSNRGCKSSMGRGLGVATKGCGGSGGSHGGTGGYGGVEPKNHLRQNRCKAHFPRPYYYGREARFEGSGGARKGGGAGGGILWLSTTGTIVLNNSKLAADGENGRVDTKNETMLGSGGGAGGSIQFICKNLKGDG